MSSMRLTFVQLRTYVDDAVRLRLTDDDQREIESLLLESPSRGAVMRGTGGLRKLRFAPTRSSRGKSGGIRIGYAFFPEHECVYFVVAFGKNEQANLSARQAAAIRDLLRDIGAALSRNVR